MVPLQPVRHSHPVSGFPSQSNQFGAHESMWQVPLTQEDVAKLVEHFVPHCPQLLKSDWVLTQALPHSVVPAGHTQAPLTHIAPLGHAVVHVPQWFGSLDRLTHAPPQLVWPEEHCVMQVPFEHTDPDGQTVPQAPQCWGSLARLTHAPPHSV
jgi:hypothetical protein